VQISLSLSQGVEEEDTLSLHIVISFLPRREDRVIPPRRTIRKLLPTSVVLTGGRRLPPQRAQRGTFKKTLNNVVLDFIMGEDSSSFC
jgi:hypothetical protein